MFDPLDIYTYERRIEERPVKKGGGRKNSGKIKQAGQTVQKRLQAISIEQLAELFTAQKMLLALGAVILARAFILGELLPFIFALMAAFGYKRRQESTVITVFALLGFLTVLEGFGLWSNIISLLLLAGVINYIQIPAEKRWWALPVLLTSVIILCKSTLLLINGLNFYLEMVIIFEAMIAGILSFVLLVASEAINEKKLVIKFSFEEITAFMVLGIGIIMGLNDVYIAGVGISNILCRLAILIAAFIWGSGGGTMVGVMCGIVPSVASSVFAQSLSIYAVSGLLAGMFRNFGRLGVIIGFMLGTMALSMFITDNQLTMLGIWETAIASLIFFFLPESLRKKVPLNMIPANSYKEFDLENMDSKIKEIAQNRIHHLAHVFDELGSTFTEKQEFESKGSHTAYLNYLYEELSHGFCEGCSRFEFCWMRDFYNTSQELLDIFTVAEKNGQVIYEECSSEFKRKCIYGRELISTINYLFDNLRMNEYWSEKIDESRELVSRQLKGISQVVKKLAEEIEVENIVDLELRSKILKAARKENLKLKDVTPVRSNGDQLYLNVLVPSCADGTVCEREICSAISSIVGERLEICDKKCPRLMGEGNCEFTLCRAFNYHIESGIAQVSREDVCGDSLAVKTLKEGKQLMVLSDGMGVGEKAALESQTAIKLLDNMLNSGFDRETALKTINSALLLRSTTETFTTLDMALIDLYSAEADFIKIASAPTFIKRGRQVAVISSSSLPMGILDEVEYVNEKRALCPRDIIVMVSDGVLETCREISGEDWIVKLLQEIRETDPQQIAELIVSQALKLSKGKAEDDMSVICSRIDLN